LSCILIKSSFSQENSKKNKAKKIAAGWRGGRRIQRNQLLTSLHKTAKKKRDSMHLQTFHLERITYYTEVSLPSAIPDYSCLPALPAWMEWALSFLFFNNGPAHAASCGCYPNCFFLATRLSSLPRLLQN
jgi:hypothetical protein